MKNCVKRITSTGSDQDNFPDFLEQEKHRFFEIKSTNVAFFSLLYPTMSSAPSSPSSSASPLSFRCCSLDELRVVQSELTSGNTNGNVYAQLSPGSAFFRKDRSLVWDDVGKGIRRILIKEEFPK